MQTEISLLLPVFLDFLAQGAFGHDTLISQSQQYKYRVQFNDFLK